MEPRQKEMKCTSCGYKGSKAEFRYLGLANSAGPDSYRRCPKCKASVYCDELNVGEQFTGEGVWGAGFLRGHSFSKKE